jgi:hypothetical protein
METEYPADVTRMLGSEVFLIIAPCRRHSRLTAVPSERE